MDLLDTSFSDKQHVAPEAPNSVRFANYIVDQLSVGMLTYLAMLFMMVTNNADGIFSAGSVKLPTTFLLVNLSYFTISEFSTGRTLGKLLTGSRVVNSDGTSPSPAQCVLRSILRLIPFYPIFFVFGVRLHDRLSNTRVVHL